MTDKEVLKEKTVDHFTELLISRLLEAVFNYMSITDDACVCAELLEALLAQSNKNKSIFLTETRKRFDLYVSTLSKYLPLIA